MTDKKIGDHKLTKTHVADEAIPANRFVKVVTATGSGTVHVVLADSGEAGCGVSRDTYASGELADVVLIGQAYVLTSENVAAGNIVSADNDGKAQVAAAAEHVMGRAMSDANSGEYVLVLLGYGGIKA